MRLSQGVHFWPTLHKQYHYVVLILRRRKGEMQQGRFVVGDVDFVVSTYATGVARQYMTVSTYILFCYDAIIVVTRAA